MKFPDGSVVAHQFDITALGLNFTESNLPDHVCLVFNSDNGNLIVHVAKKVLGHLSQDAQDLSRGAISLRRRKF